MKPEEDWLVQSLKDARETLADLPDWMKKAVDADARFRQARKDMEEQ